MATKRPPAKKPVKIGYGFSSANEIRQRIDSVREMGSDAVLKARESFECTAKTLAEMTRIEVKAKRESDRLCRLMSDLDSQAPEFIAARDSRIALDVLRRECGNEIDKVKALLHDFIS